MKKLSLILCAAFLLSACCGEKSMQVTVVNPSGIDRVQETVEVCMDDIAKALRMKEGDSLLVLTPCGKEIPYQISKACHSALLFQVSVKAGDSVNITLSKGSPSIYETKAQTTFMPRRKDDMSWENDKVCFRMYGPALVTDPQEGMVSGGLDIWVKRTKKLVSQKWYQDEFDGKSSYHHDNGEGLDFYSVGKTLGAGAMAPFIDGKLWTVGSNFVSYEIIENGPVRTTFLLNYDAYDVNGRQVSEKRLISLDAGSHLNKVCVFYEGNDDMTVAAGFPFRGFQTPAKSKKDHRGIQDCPDIISDTQAGYVAYAEPEHPENGIIFLGSLMTTPVTEALISNNHVLNCTKATAGKPVVYYSGGAWSKGGFSDLKTWAAYMAEYAVKIKQPLQVKYVSVPAENCGDCGQHVCKNK